MRYCSPAADMHSLNVPPTVGSIVGASSHSAPAGGRNQDPTVSPSRQSWNARADVVAKRRRRRTTDGEAISLVERIARKAALRDESGDSGTREMRNEYNASRRIAGVLATSVAKSSVSG